MSAERWKVGSAARNKLRGECERDGRCTTCCGFGSWRMRPKVTLQTVSVICPNCNGNGWDPPQVKRSPRGNGAA